MLKHENGLACLSFMDASRRYKVAGSETKDSIGHTATAVARGSAFLCWLSEVLSQRYAKWALLPKRNPELGDSESFIMVNKHACSLL